MNLFIVSGCLTAEPTYQRTQNDKAYCRFTVANNTGYGDKQKTNFFNFTAWNGTADFAAKHLTKGTKVCVIGSIDQNKYKNNEGVDISTYQGKVDELEIMDWNSAKKQEQNVDRGVSDGESEFYPMDGFDGGFVPF